MLASVAGGHGMVVLCLFGELATLGRGSLAGLCLGMAEQRFAGRSPEVMVGGGRGAAGAAGDVLGDLGGAGQRPPLAAPGTAGLGQVPGQAGDVGEEVAQLSLAETKGGLLGVGQGCLSGSPVIPRVRFRGDAPPGGRPAAPGRGP